MIIFLNGAFGVGKTSIAKALCRRLPHAMLYDPEIVGGALHRLTEGVRHPAEDTDDFQDIQLWPPLTVTIAEALYGQYGRSLLIPMTIAQPDYLATIRQGCARIGPPVHHFCLTASLETIRQRLDARGDTGECWAWCKSVACVPQLGSEQYRIHIDTERRSVDSIAQEILGHLGSVHL